MGRTLLYTKRVNERLICKFYKGHPSMDEAGLVIYLENDKTDESIRLRIETFNKIIKVVKEFDTLGKFLINEGTKQV